MTFERTKPRQAQDPTEAHEEKRASFYKSMRRGLASAGLFIGGAAAIGVWDSTNPTSYIPWFTQAENFLRSVLPTPVTNQLALTDGSQVYQATIMIGSAIIAYLSLRDTKFSKLKDTITRNVSTLLMWLPNMVLGDCISASLRTNDNTRTISLIVPDPVSTGVWRRGVTQHSTWLHPLVMWGDSPSAIIPNIPHFYELGMAMTGGYIFTRLVGFELYDRHRAKKLLRQTATTDEA